MYVFCVIVIEEYMHDTHAIGIGKQTVEKTDVFKKDTNAGKQ